jgi:hypothetical protein
VAHFVEKERVVVRDGNIAGPVAVIVGLIVALGLFEYFGLLPF